MPNAAVIDLSHWNTIPSSLRTTKASGVFGVIHKATEGTTSTDEKMPARYSLAKDAGLLWGAYHFLRPGSMEQQVAYFINYLTNYHCLNANTLLAADYEDPEVSLDDLILFMQLLESNTNRSPVLYSGHVLKEKLGTAPSPKLNKYRLWLAQYADKPTLPPGWDHYFLWQFTDKGSIAGVNPPTDLNSGDIEEILEHWSGFFDPMPAPEPTKQLLVKVIVPLGVKVEVFTSEGE